MMNLLLIPALAALSPSAFAGNGELAGPAPLEALAALTSQARSLRGPQDPRRKTPLPIPQTPALPAAEAVLCYNQPVYHDATPVEPGRGPVKRVSFELLDHREGAQRTKRTLDMGPAGLDFQKKVALVLDRLAKVDPYRAGPLKARLASFYQQMLPTPSSRMPVVGHAQYDPSMMENCLVKTLAVQYPEAGPGQVKFQVDQQLIEAAPQDARAGLVLNLLLGEGIKHSLPQIRRLNFDISSTVMAEVADGLQFAFVLHDAGFEPWALTTPYPIAHVDFNGADEIIELSLSADADVWVNGSLKRLRSRTRILTSVARGQTRRPLVYGVDTPFSTLPAGLTFTDPTGLRLVLDNDNCLRVDYAHLFGDRKNALVLNRAGALENQACRFTVSAPGMRFTANAYRPYFTKEADGSWRRETGHADLAPGEHELTVLGTPFELSGPLSMDGDSGKSTLFCRAAAACSARTACGAYAIKDKAVFDQKGCALSGTTALRAR